MAGFHDQSNDRLAVTKCFRVPAAGTRIPNETSAEKKTKKPNESMDMSRCRTDGRQQPEVDTATRQKQMTNLWLRYFSPFLQGNDPISEAANKKKGNIGAA